MRPYTYTILECGHSVETGYDCSICAFKETVRKEICPACSTEFEDGTFKRCADSIMAENKKLREALVVIACGPFGVDHSRIAEEALSEKVAHAQ